MFSLIVAFFLCSLYLSGTQGYGTLTDYFITAPNYRIITYTQMAIVLLLNFSWE